MEKTDKLIPPVSVILPVYNGARTLHQAIDSVLNQTMTEFELIIVDDGSSDSSMEVVQSFNDPRIQYHANKHSGLSVSLNLGIRKSASKYIARMDADDRCMSNRLEFQYRYLEANPDLDVLASKVHFNGYSSSKGIKHYVEWQNNLITHEEMFRNRFVDSPMVHPSVMVRRSSFEKFGLYQESKGPEDFELWLRWMDRGAKFHKLEEVLMEWTDHPDRLTRSDSNYAREEFFKLKATYFSKWFLDHQSKKNLWIIGAGRLVYQRTEFLTAAGIEISGFVDFKANLSVKRKVISYSEMAGLENSFFLSYVNDRTGRIKVHDFLIQSGYIESQDFYMMA